MQRWRWTGMIVFASLATGCAKDSPPPNGYGTAAAAQADADSQFQASHRNPITAQTRFAAGQLAESEGDAAGAIVQYSAALQLDPNNAPTLYRLGLVYASQREFSKAIETWKRYIAATEGSAAGYSNLGYCLDLSGQPAEAEATYQEGIVKDPGNAACRMNYGLMLARQNRLLEATDQLKVVLTPAEVHYNLASVLESQGKKDKARVEYGKALQLDPDMADARARLAGL